jgi:sesquipedalian
MRINEKTLLFFANSKPVDKEGYLLKRGEGEWRNLRDEAAGSFSFLVPLDVNFISFKLAIASSLSLIVIAIFFCSPVNKAFQKRWFVLKGNLLFYFEKRGGDLLGFIILEGCVIELAETETEKYCFNINFHQNRTYVLSAESQDSLEAWMRALTCSGFDYMRLMVSELQRQLDEIDKASSSSSEPERPSDIPPIPPRRQNPFNKFNGKTISLLTLKTPH